MKFPKRSSDPKSDQNMKILIPALEDMTYKKKFILENHQGNTADTPSSQTSKEKKEEEKRLTLANNQ